MAQITSSVIHHGQEQQLIFQGEKARISAPWKTSAHLVQPNGFPRPEQNEPLIKELNAFYESIPRLTHTIHTGQIDDVLSAIESGRKLLVDGEDGRRTIELITAIYKAGSEERTVKLPIQRGDPFYTVTGILDRVPRFYQKTNFEGDQGGSITLGSDYQKK